MCGIAGVYRFRDGDPDDVAVRAMMDRLRHRGPDDEGIEVDGPVTFGHRRLAILDLSSSGHQPMRSSSGRHLIVFNGEIYNFAELRDELGLRDDELRSTSDTEILLCAWERWGDGALERLVGQWAFAVYDRQERRLWLARDRFGEKPLFYHRDAERLTFASSVDALVQSPWVPRALDPNALGEFLALRYAVSPRTVLENVLKLPPGHLLVADETGVRVSRWYEPQFRQGPRAGRRELVEEFDSLFTQACRRCLVSDVPVALLLSDGIDSNGIHAALRRAGDDVPSITYVFSESGSTRSGPIASADPDAVELRVDAASGIDSLVPAFSTFTEPTGDGAALATWLLIRNARDRATVFLCGHGGDEILGGYRLSQDRFRLAVIRRLAQAPEPWVRGILERHAYGAEPIEERRQALLAVPPRRSPEAMRYTINRPLPPGDLREMFDGRGMPEPYLGVVDELYKRCPEPSSDLDRMQKVMLHTFLPENICCFADSMAMASSAELRMPYLDRDLVDFVMRLPPSGRVSHWPGRANTKLILRWWAKSRLPEHIVKLRKRPFRSGNLPALLRTDRKRLTELVLGHPAVRRELPGLEKWLSRDPAYYRGPWEGTLWALISLGVWCERVGVR